MLQYLECPYCKARTTFDTLASMLVTLLPMVMEVRPEQYWNILSVDYQ